MTTSKKKTPPASQLLQHDSYWARTAKEIAAAAAMAALPILLNSIAEALLKKPSSANRDEPCDKILKPAAH